MDASEGGRGASWGARPPWLQPADLEALAGRFPPLDAAQVRQLALAFDQGSTPVEILLLRLEGDGLAPPAARRLIVELRLLRERRSRETAPSGAEGGEVAAALTAAARSYLLHPGDEEQAASAIVAQVGWTPARARWFLSVNQDRVRQTLDRLRAEHPPDT